jgi:hypothetical protein
MSSTNLGIPLLVDSQSSKYITVNDAINLLDEAMNSLLAVTMTDADYTFSSGASLEAAAFVMSGTLTAARNVIVPNNAKFMVFENSTTGGFPITVKTAAGTGIAVANGSGYALLYCNGTNVSAVGTAASGGPFDVSVFAPGVGTASQKLARIPFARAVVFPAGAALSVAKASANATASTTFTLTKNGTAFATVNFATGAAVGTWTQASVANFAAGDVLEIDGPGTADATLADVGITLSGTR